MICFRVYFQGQATDVKIRVEELLRVKEQLNSIYVKHTKQPYEVIGKIWKISPNLLSKH